MKQFSTQAAEATKRMRELFSATPLQRNDHLSTVYGADIWLKREDLSLSGTVLQTSWRL